MLASFRPAVESLPLVGLPHGVSLIITMTALRPLLSQASHIFVLASLTNFLRQAIPSHTRSPKDLPSVPPSLHVPLISGPSPLSLLCAAQPLSSFFHLINSILILVSMALSDPETRISLCNKITSLYLWVKYLFPLLSCKLCERKKKVSLLFAPCCVPSAYLVLCL